MPEAQEVVTDTDNYLPAFWYAMGKTGDDLAIASVFANHYKLARMENVGGPCGIPQSWIKWRWKE